MKSESKEEIAEDVCFSCKDGGELRICDDESCLKAYHATCVGKDPEFLESNEHWTCGWHSCFLCKRISIFQCFCCPKSVCASCVGTANFVVLRDRKGFCIECLKLSLMIENDLDVDSDGDKVDFTDTETLEFLFKDYWPILKEKENLSIDDLHKADAILKRSSANNATVLDKNFNDEVTIDKNDLEEDAKIERSVFRTKGCCISKVKKIMRRYRSNKKQFIGWGSKELICFLQSIGKATEREFSQPEVLDIVKEYIQANKLLNPHKKKRVICDSRLHALFGRKSVSRLKINNLLDLHFASNEMSDDELVFSSEDENDRKQQRLSFDQKTGKSVLKWNAMIEQKSAYACITVKNIRAVYLKRSLIEEFLKSTETFDSKVTGCFVRIRSSAKANLRNSHQLVQITGTTLTEGNRMGEMHANIVLLVLDLEKVIHIHMISDDEFSQEECEELGLLMKQGLFRRPTVEELERKALALHEDITNHRIKKEILLLQNMIKRANEKGWRRELVEYYEKLEMLQKPAEQARLLQERPTIVADAETEIPNAATESEAHDDMFKETENANIAVQGQVPHSEGNATETANVTTDAASKETGTATIIINIESAEDNFQTDTTMEMHSSFAKKPYTDTDHDNNRMKKPSTDPDHINGHPEKASAYIDNDNCYLNITATIEETEETNEDSQLKHENQSSQKEGDVEDVSTLLWMYVDPSGAIQGPFSLEDLRGWSEEGYFTADFKVWKTHQSQEAAISLSDILDREALMPE